jgi:hypothetical protein
MSSISATPPPLNEPASAGRLFKSGGECASFCESTSPS